MRVNSVMGFHVVGTPPPAVPKATGSDIMPPWRSPSMDLKSFTMAMPRPAKEYSTVSTMTSGVSSPNTAWPAHHGSAM